MSTKLCADKVEEQGVCYTVEHVDTDASGVVHFSRYASLCETAALDKLDELQAGLDKFRSFGLDLRVRELHVKYLASARFRDRLRLRAELKHVGIARIRIVVEVTTEIHDASRTLMVQAELDFAVVDWQTGSPARIPDALKDLTQGDQNRS